MPVRDLHKSMFYHLDCHLNEIIFLRCQDLTCCGEWRCSSVKESLAKNEYRLPALDMSKQYEGHYETYLRSLSESSFGFDHSFQPSVKIASLGKCEICPSFYFKSKTGTFVMSPCSTGDKKELTLERFHVTLAGRCFQACQA